MNSYKELIDKYGIEIAEKAGYIEPQLCKNIDEANRTSPEVTDYVLLTTGCFSPLHSGHVQMMNEAKNWLESQGETASYGSFILAHQNYIREKHNRYTLEERQYLAQSLIGDYNWLHVDMRANLYYDNDTNFTQLMTELYAKSPTQAYVFGSDRYEFGYIALTDNRLYICVIRDKNDIEKVKALYDKLNLSNLVYIIPDEINTISSTEVYQSTTLPRPRNGKRLAIRDDGLFAYSTLDKDKYENFKRELEQAFLQCSPFEQIDWIDVNTQLRDVPDFKNKVISLDKYYHGDIQLNISRYFDLGGWQQHANDLVFSTQYDEEIELAPLNINLPDDRYVLVDDDSISGYTFNKLKDSVDTIVSTYTLMTPGYDDVVDARDFIIGAKYSGLLCKQSNGKLKRYPYLWPEVNLYHRASINLNKQQEFTQLVKKANKKLIEKA